MPPASSVLDSHFGNVSGHVPISSGSTISLRTGALSSLHPIPSTIKPSNLNANFSPRRPPSLIFVKHARLHGLPNTARLAHPPRIIYGPSHLDAATRQHHLNLPSLTRHASQLSSGTLLRNILRAAPLHLHHRPRSTTTHHNPHERTSAVCVLGRLFK